MGYRRPAFREVTQHGGDFLPRTVKAGQDCNIPPMCSVGYACVCVDGVATICNFGKKHSRRPTISRVEQSPGTDTSEAGYGNVA